MLFAVHNNIKYNTIRTHTDIIYIGAYTRAQDYGLLVQRPLEGYSILSRII